MTTYVLVHGGAAAHCWELVAAALRRQGHEVVRAELPAHDDEGDDHAAVVADAIGDRGDLILVTHAVGGSVARTVCRRAPVELLVVVAGIVPQASDAPMPDPWPVDAWAEVPTHYLLGDEGAFWFPERAGELADRLDALRLAAL